MINKKNRLFWLGFEYASNNLKSFIIDYLGEAPTIFHAF